uniref:Troponin T2, cardiac type n=1 Tax=Homo sapiens TaxID=9606 RepID=A0A590UJV2_HUMAN
MSDIEEVVEEYEEEEQEGKRKRVYSFGSKTAWFETDPPLLSSLAAWTSLLSRSSC